MVLFLPSERGWDTLEEAAARVQPHQLLLHQVQEVPECPEYDIHIPNGRLLVRILVIFNGGFSLDDTDERNCDYLVAINFFTAYLLQLIGRLKESLNFVAVAERMLFKLLSKLKPENKPTISAR